MHKKPNLARLHRYTVRIDQQCANHIDEAMKSRELSTRNDYLVWLVQQHREGLGGPVKAVEDLAAKSFAEFHRRISNMGRLIATIDAFAHAAIKLFLVSSPQPDPETRQLAQSTAAKRYERLLQNAAKELQGKEDVLAGEDL